MFVSLLDIFELGSIAREFEILGYLLLSVNLGLFFAAILIFLNDIYVETVNSHQETSIIKDTKCREKFCEVFVGINVIGYGIFMLIVALTYEEVSLAYLDKLNKDYVI
jgi:hypothetical protein